MFDIDEVKVKILWRMYRHRYIGGKHTDIANLRKGFPKNRYKQVEHAIDELIRNGYLLVKPTHHVSINKVTRDKKNYRGIRQVEL